MFIVQVLDTHPFDDHAPTPVRPSQLVLVALALLLAGAIPALAMSDAIPPSGTCDWPTAVRAGGVCSGVFVGNGIVLTSGHCILNNGNVEGGNIYFGEAPQSEISVPVSHCVRHPSGSGTLTNGGGFQGVDLAYCVMEQNVTLPRVPVLVDECEGDYVRHRMFNTIAPLEVTAIGSGCIDSNCTTSGTKRDAVFQLTEQRYTKGSWKLVATYPNGETPLRTGDSGGPLMVEMADGSWRVIGLYHGVSTDDVWERVPPYVRWIETDSGRDITPCYDWDPVAAAYTFDGAADSCSDTGHAVNPENGGGAGWPICLSGEASQQSECAGWLQPIRHPQITIGPMGTAGDDEIVLAGNHVYQQCSGGAGFDLISGSRFNDRILPGSGGGEVRAEAGDDTVLFLDVCELQHGGLVDGGAGNDMLVLPVPLQQAQQLGLEVTGFERIRIDSRNSAESDCTPNVGSIQMPGSSVASDDLDSGEGR